MALRELVEGDCGAANPLVQWSSHFHQHKPLAQGGVHHDRLQEVGHNLYPNKLFSAFTNLLNRFFATVSPQNRGNIGQIENEVLYQDSWFCCRKLQVRTLYCSFLLSFEVG